MADDLKDLPPEERIKKLKELKEKRKKQIKEAEELLKESEQEMNERRSFEEKVPIPEFAAESAEGLSDEAKEILKERKGIGQIKEEESVPEPQKKDTLEVFLDEQPHPLSPNPIQVQYDITAHQQSLQYVEHLSQVPMYQLQQDVYEVQQKVQSGASLSARDRQVLYTRQGAIEQKLKDADSGRYKNWNQKIAQTARSVKETTGKLLSSAYLQSSHTKYDA